MDVLPFWLDWALRLADEGIDDISASVEGVATRAAATREEQNYEDEAATQADQKHKESSRHATRAEQKRKESLGLEQSVAYHVSRGLW